MAEGKVYIDWTTKYGVYIPTHHCGHREKESKRERKRESERAKERERERERENGRKRESERAR